MNIFGFFHIYNHPKCGTADIVRELIESLDESGLKKATQKIYACVLGKTNEIVDKLLEENNIEVLERDPNRLRFEFITLNHLREFCRSTEPSRIWYIHSKGSGNCKSKTVIHDPKDNWRYFARWRLTYNIILHWKEFHDALKENEVSGSRLQRIDRIKKVVVAGKKSYILKYAGNFWWARSDYVKKLPLLPRQARPHFGRLKAEKWICKKVRNVANINIPGFDEWFEKNKE